MSEMTSWIRQSRSTGLAKSREELDVVFQTGASAGLCTQFNRYFYHVVYSRRIGKELLVKDAPSIMGDTYPLLRSVFADISGVRFMDRGALPAGSQNQGVKLFDAVSRTPRDTLRAVARDVLRWRPEVEAQIQGMLTAMGIPDRFDIGVHMRTGTKSVDRYIRAVEAFAQTAPPGRKVRVFVASDNAAMLKEFESRMTDSPHEVYNIAGAAASGFVAAAWGAKSFDDKFNDAMVFFTELYLLQRCPMLVCALSSNVGKFLLLTAASARNFKSVDLPELVPL